MLKKLKKEKNYCKPRINELNQDELEGVVGGGVDISAVDSSSGLSVKENDGVGVLHFEWYDVDFPIVSPRDVPEVRANLMIANL